MKTPTLYYPEEVAQMVRHVAKEIEPGRWVPCRPLNYMGGLRWRLRLAWRVFVGRADVLQWEGQP